MFSLNRKNLFRILTIYSMAILFLPIFVGNVPFPLNILTRTLILGPIWLLFILIFYPKMLTSKYLLTVYIFFTILLLGWIIFWNDKIITGIGNITIKWIIIDLFGLFLPILIYQYFIKTRDYKGLAMVILIALIFIFITSVTTILGLKLYPDAVRNMISVATVEESNHYNRLGIATYGFFAGITYLFPVLVYYIKNKQIQFKIKIFLYIFVISLFYSLIKAEFTTSLLLSFIFFLFSFLVQKKTKKSGILIIFFFFLSFFIFNNIIADFFYKISEYTVSSTLKFRLKDVGDVLALQDYNVNSDKTYFSATRISLVKLSFSKFLDNPIIGGGWGGGHSTWVDRLGLFGILGFSPWVLIFWQQIKLNLSIFDDSYKIYYLISFISCIALGILTTMANSVQAGSILFLIVPGIYFLKYLKNND